METNSHKLPKLAVAAPARSCESEEQHRIYCELAERVYRKHDPASDAERTLTNDILVATWLLHGWKLQCADRRRAYRALRRENPQAPELAALKEQWDHGEWHAGKQSLFLSRRRRLFAELREEYERRLAEAGYTLEEAREAYYASVCPEELPLAEAA
jgi:hypothetical protein